LWLHSLKVAQLLRSAACLHTNQSRSYLNHLVQEIVLLAGHELPPPHYGLPLSSAQKHSMRRGTGST